MLARLVAAVGCVALVLLGACTSPDPPDPSGADSVQTDALQVDSLRADSLRVDSLRLDSLQGAALRLDSLRRDSLRRDSLRRDSLRLDSIRTAAIRADTVVALLAAVRAELQRSREARDSLRDALATMEALPAPDAAPQTAAEDTPSEASAGDDGSLRDEVRETAQNFGLRLAVAVVVLMLTFFLIKGVVFVLDSLSERSADRRLLYKRIVPIARVLIWAMALYVVLRGIFNVDAQGLIAAAAAIGVAVGFAAQDLLKNIFGGLVIIFDTPFQVGDKIAVGGTYGEVINIGLRSTRIVTPDDNLVSVPNAQVVDGQVSNANAGALDCQVVTDLYLPGDVDEARAKQIAYQAAASSKYTYLGKPIVVIVKDEYEHGHVVHLKVKAYVLDTRYEFLLASEVTERARRAYRREGLLVWTAPVAASGAPPESPPDSPSTPTGGGDGEVERLS